MQQEWQQVKEIHAGAGGVMLGEQGAHALMGQPDRMALMMARYWAAAGLIGNCRTVLEIGCGEGMGAGILHRNRLGYIGVDYDQDAVQAALRMWGGRETGLPWGFQFSSGDATKRGVLPERWADAVVSLDVIEHIPAEREDAFMANIVKAMRGPGPCVIGTPNALAHHLASPASQAGHINLFTHERLLRLMQSHFNFVQMFGMNDVGLHFGHPDMRHYHMAVGVGVRETAGLRGGV